jgi:serine/threonine protein kinase
MPPEQCRGEPTDARSDLYALTCSYYQLLTGQIPFPGDSPAALMYRHCHEPFPDAAQLVTGLPDGVLRILGTGSQKDPAKRYLSAATMLADLDAVLHTPEESHTFEGTTQAIATPQLPSTPRRRLGIQLVVHCS